MPRGAAQLQILSAVQLSLRLEELPGVLLLLGLGLRDLLGAREGGLGGRGSAVGLDRKALDRKCERAGIAEELDVAPATADDVAPAAPDDVAAAADAAVPLALVAAPVATASFTTASSAFFCCAACVRSSLP